MAVSEGRAREKYGEPDVYIYAAGVEHLPGEIGMLAGPSPDIESVINRPKKKNEDGLRDTLRQARACLMNLQPESGGPIAQQMQKMIHEISVALGEK